MLYRSRRRGRYRDRIPNQAYVSKHHSSILNSYIYSLFKCRPNLVMLFCLQEEIADAFL